MSKKLWCLCGAFLCFILSLLLVFGVTKLAGYKINDYHSLSNLVQLLPGYKHPELQSKDLVLRDTFSRATHLNDESGMTVVFYTRGAACGADNCNLWVPVVQNMTFLTQNATRIVMIIGDNAKDPIPLISKFWAQDLLHGLADVYGDMPPGDLPLSIGVLYDTNFSLGMKLGIAKRINGGGVYPTSYFVQPSIFAVSPNGEIKWLDIKEEKDWARPTQIERPSVKVLDLFLVLNKFLGG